MRIGYLISQYPAASHTFIRREVAALRRLGAAIDTFSVRHPPAEEVMSDLDRRDVEETFYLLPAGPGRVLANNLRMFARHPLRYLSSLRLSLRHRNPGLRALVFALFYFLEGMLLAQELEARGVKHLHNHFANSASHVALAATHYLDIGLSLTLHGLCDFDYPAGPLLGEKLAASRFVVCATQYGAAQAMRLSDPAHWSKLSVVRCGVELDKLPPRQAAPKEGKGRLRFICVGRLSPEKGQLGLMDAFADAVTRGLDAELVLVGDGPDRAQVEARIAQNGLEARVQLLGRLPEARALEETAASDVVVMASFMEGLPVALMEALALKVPVIAPAVAGVPELVVHGESGLLFAAGDWHQLADQMLELEANPELRAKLATDGRRRIEEGFDVDRAVRPLLAEFHRVLPPAGVVEPLPDGALPVTGKQAAAGRGKAADAA